MIINVSKRTMIVITIFVALILLFLLSFDFIEIFKTRYYKKATATVKEISDDYEYASDQTASLYYKVYFTYDVDGREYTNYYDLKYKFGYSVGKKITIYYDSNNPQNIRKKNGVNYLLVSFTGIMLLLCIYVLVKGNFNN